MIKPIRPSSSAFGGKRKKTKAEKQEIATLAPLSEAIKQAGKARREGGNSLQNYHDVIQQQGEEQARRMDAQARALKESVPAEKKKIRGLGDSELLEYIRSARRISSNHKELEPLTEIYEYALKQLAKRLKAKQKAAKVQIKVGIDALGLSFHRFHQAMAVVSRNSLRNPKAWQKSADVAREALKTELDGMGLAHVIDWTPPEN